MEYTKMQYFLFKIGELFNSKLFIVVVALIIVVGTTLLFVYDYKNDGPILAHPSESNDHQRNKHLKKANNKAEILLVIIPVFLLIILFGIKMALNRVPSPSTIVPNKSEKRVTKGKVLWVHESTGKVAITTGNRGNENPIVASVNSNKIDPDAPLISSYAGTGISNKEFLTLNPGDSVEINTHPYTWLYKNHTKYGDDEHASSVMNMLNLAKVNGDVIKSSSKNHKKKVNKNINYNTDSQSLSYSNSLE